MKILIIEDEDAMRELINKSLTKERYVVEEAKTLREATFKIEDYDYDCILLDVMLPDGNGLSLLNKLKDLRKNTSIIILSAKDSLDDKVAGLELGADDYLPKPFHLAELHARIRSVIRRKSHDGNMAIELGNVKIIPQNFQVCVADKPLTLGRKEYDILTYFVNRPNHMINKETLAEAVWGDHIDQTDSFDFIYAQMKNLRKKLNDAHADIEIKSVYGFGYKLVVNQND